MVQVYLTKDRHIFESDLSTESNGVRYMIDAANIDNIKAYPLKELATLGEKRDFISRYIHDFSLRAEAAWLDDLDSLIEKEFVDDDRYERLTAAWGSDMLHWKKRRDELLRKLYEEAVRIAGSRSE